MNRLHNFTYDLNRFRFDLDWLYYAKLCHFQRWEAEKNFPNFCRQVSIFFLIYEFAVFHIITEELWSYREVNQN